MIKAFKSMVLCIGIALGAGCLDEAPGDLETGTQAVEVVTDDGLEEMPESDSENMPDCHVDLELVEPEDALVSKPPAQGCTNDQWRACDRGPDLLTRAACRFACLADEGVAAACRGVPSNYRCKGWPAVWARACKLLGY